jgi:hypothetical protein
VRRGGGGGGAPGAGARGAVATYSLLNPFNAATLYASANVG